MKKENEKAPEFTAIDQTNTSICLSQFAGQNVVLYFYPKDNTPGCTVEANAFSQLNDAFKHHNTVVIGVSKDTIQSHQTFCQSQKLRITLLSDPDMTLIEPYGIWQEKKNYGKTYMGIVRSTFLIDGQGIIKKVWKNVKVKGHAETVLKTVKESAS
jgi:peroxiredoxin Q/BCP